MRIVFAFFVCTIATWALFNYVFGIHLAAQDVPDTAGLTILYMFFGGIGAAFIENVPTHDFYIARIFHKLADLIEACTERMRKG